MIQLKITYPDADDDKCDLVFHAVEEIDIHDRMVAFISHGNEQTLYFSENTTIEIDEIK